MLRVSSNPNTNPINALGIAPGPNHHQKDRLASAAVLLTIVNGTNPIQVPKKSKNRFVFRSTADRAEMPSGRKSPKPRVPSKGAAGKSNNPIIRPGLMPASSPGPSGTKTPGDAADTVSNPADDAPVGSSRAVVAAATHTNPASEPESSAAAADINPADDAPVGSSRAVVASSSNAGPADAPVGSSRAVAAATLINPADDAPVGSSRAVAAATLINPADDAPVGSSRAVAASSNTTGPAGAPAGSSRAASASDAAITAIVPDNAAASTSSTASGGAAANLISNLPSERSIADERVWKKVTKDRRRNSRKRERSPRTKNVHSDSRDSRGSRDKDQRLTPDLRGRRRLRRHPPPRPARP